MMPTLHPLALYGRPGLAAAAWLVFIPAIIWPASASAAAYSSPTEIERALDLLAVPPEQRALAALADAGALRRVLAAPKSEAGSVVGAVSAATALLSAPPAPRAPGPVPARAGSSVMAAIASAARATGAPLSYLLRTARRESGFDPQAAAANSTALGLFQFIDGTWLGAIDRYGRRHGAPDVDLSRADERRLALAWRRDPWLSARMAAELTLENRAALRRSFGREPHDHELYAAHFLGAADAVRLIRAASAAPGLVASRLLPRAALANPAIFHPRGRPIGCAELLEKLRHG